MNMSKKKKSALITIQLHVLVSFISLSRSLTEKSELRRCAPISYAAMSNVQEDREISRGREADYSLDANPEKYFRTKYFNEHCMRVN